MSPQDGATAMSRLNRLKNELKNTDEEIGRRLCLCQQHQKLVNSVDGLKEEDAEEQVGRLREQLAALKLDGDDKTQEEDRARAKEVFGLLMRAGFRREKDVNSKFQPCKDDLQFLKGMAPALCRRLRIGTLRDFCRILHPAPFDARFWAGRTLGRWWVGFDDKEIKERLEHNDSIFHLHRNSVENDYTEFLHQTARAETLAGEIESTWRRDRTRPVQVRLLDGHGRMLVCLIKAVMDLDLDPDEVLDLTVFEIDEEVHGYHQYVFPRCIKKRKETVIDIRRNMGKEEEQSAVIYLNFCSVPPGDKKSWDAYFRNQSASHWVPHCCKETVLKYMWEVTHHPYYCTVMISLVIKDTSAEGGYTSKLGALGGYFTGLGFVRVLRNSNLFDAKLVSVRPEDGIVWVDPHTKRVPKSIKGCKQDGTFVTLLVRPKRGREGAALQKLDDEFKKLTSIIADLKEYTMRVGALVQTPSGEMVRISSRIADKLYTLDGKSYEIDGCHEVDAAQAGIS